MEVRRPDDWDDVDVWVGLTEEEARDISAREDSVIQRLVSAIMEVANL